MGDAWRSIVGRVTASGPLQILLLLAAVAIILSPTVRADFLWDDFKQIVDSPAIGDLSRIPFYFSHNVVQSAGNEGVNAPGVDLYRPLFMVSLAAVYAINGPDPFWYHLSVLVVHLVVCLLLMALALRWLDSRPAAAVAVFFFACHPVTAEAYLWPSAISEAMSTVGLLAASLLLDRHCGSARTGSRAWIAASAAGVVFLAGLLSKEAVLMALPALSLFLVKVRRVRPRFLIPVWSAGAIFLLMRSLALAGLQATGTGAAQRLDALKIYPVLVIDGLRAMLTMQPIGIRHLSWEYATISWSTCAVATAFCLVLMAIFIHLRKTLPLALTATFTTGLMLLPIALVATVPGWGGFGRYLYVPLAVTSLALAELGLWTQRALAAGRPRLHWAVPLIVALALVVELFGLRHALWVYANQENLARAAIEIFPDGPDGWEWLGNVYLDRGELEEARECYRKSVERGPELFRPRHNLAAALLYTGRPAEALEQLAILESTHQPTAPGSKIAVTALIELGRWDEAATRLVDSLDRDPNYAPLVDTTTRLLAEHPRPDALRRWLSQELARPEHHAAANIILPILED